MESPVPIQQQERIFILDVIRGVALCGILILNIGYFGFSYSYAGFNMNVLKETSFANILSWYTTNFILEGSFRALFSMLFGASALLILSRLTQRSTGLLPADIYYRRLIWLLIFGLINAHVFLWPGDILYAYAICGLFIFPLRNLSPRWLILLALFFIAVIMFKTELKINDRMEMRDKGVAAQLIRDAKKDSLSEEQHADLTKWEENQKEGSAPSLKKKAEEEIEKVTSPSYAKVWSYMNIWNVKIESSMFYDSIFFDAMLFILFGMAFYKSGLLTGDKPLWWYVVLVVVGYGLGMGSGYFVGHAWRLANYRYFEYVKIQSPLWELFYQPHRLLVSLGHLGLLIVLWKSRAFQWLLKPFANLGQMAFSNYLMQSIICGLIFYGFAFAYFGKLERYELAYVVLSVWIFQLIFSAIWLHFFLMGPFEWLWRSLTYWKLQPMKRASGTK